MTFHKVKTGSWEMSLDPALHSRPPPLPENLRYDKLLCRWESYYNQNFEVRAKHFHHTKKKVEFLFFILRQENGRIKLTYNRHVLGDWRWTLLAYWPGWMGRLRERIAVRRWVVNGCLTGWPCHLRCSASLVGRNTSLTMKGLDSLLLWFHRSSNTSPSACNCRTVHLYVTHIRQAQLKTI